MSTIAAPLTPLYQLGELARASRPLIRRRHKFGGSVRNPGPMYQLGAAAQIVGATAPIAAVATTAAITAAAGGSAAAAGTTAGAVAGPIGAAVGAIIGIVAGLMAAHELRARQARNENAAVNLGVQGFDEGVKQLAAAYRAGQISTTDVQQGLQVIMGNYWNEVGAQIQPGRNGCSVGAACPPDTSPAGGPGYTPSEHGAQPCTGAIGAACCIGCYPLSESITNPNGILAALAGQSSSTNGPYKAEVLAVGASKYGTNFRAAYTLDFTPPAPSPGPIAGLASAIGPTAVGGSGGSVLVPLAVFLLAFFLLR
jgi:hypothetical protein